MERYQEIERSIIKKYRKPIWKRFIKGVNEYKLIQEGDKIAVCISGGKDSMLLAKLIQEVQRHGVVNFDAEYLVMDPGYNQINRQVVENNAKLLNIPITIFETNIYDSVAEVDSSPCYLCARMRRGYLYKEAQKLGCNKIALGHHFDDVIETILLGMLYGGQVQTMMPKLHSTNHPGMELIRPMYLVREADIIAWSRYNDLQFIQCACRLTENCSLCDNGGGGSKRQEIKALLKRLRKDSPYIDTNIYNSVQNVNLNTIIGYHDDKKKYHFLDDYDTKGGQGC
ncbi:MAG: tRNA 2-thiocytidine biosynthesis protein TtcA [Clostridiales bacterium]|nr:tRNA 2-thiocytidine biosynthesis protein TtcA [Clostridiales bacterium]